LLAAHGAVVQRVEFDHDEQVVVATVRVRRRDQDRCGICRRRCPRYDQGRGPRRWRTLDVGTIQAFLQPGHQALLVLTHLRNGDATARLPYAIYGTAILLP
jgi:transposase